MTLRIVCPIETAANRVRLRLASGERGPNQTAIRQIDAELDQARDIDIMFTNEASVEHFHRRIDVAMQVLELDSGHDESIAAIMRQLEKLAIGEVALTRDS